jgi:ADP-heptose:LPS heptosyltransferase
MRILALIPGGIGDQLLFFPTLDDLKRAYPNASIDVIVEPRSTGAYRVCKYAHDRSLNTINFDFKDRNGLADWMNFLGIIRDREYDVVLSLGQKWVVGFLLWLTGVPVRVGYAGTAGELFLTNPVPLKSEQYAAHMYHDLLKGLNVNTPCPELSVTLLKEDIEWAENAQAQLGVKDSGYILIHGGSSQKALDRGIDKIYPAQKWQQVIQQIQQRQPGLPIVLAKGPEDDAWVEQLLSACPDVKTVEPEDVGKLAATIAGANLILCTDSAPMHLAVAVKTYTIALFGPTEPEKLLPETDKAIAVKSPTGKMADIEPNAIIEKMFG